MVFSSRGEFEVQVADVLLRVDRICDERSNDHPLASARRSLSLLAERFKKSEKIGPRDRLTLSTSLETIRQAMGSDSTLEERLFDIEDYVDLHLLLEPAK
jgi:hypothetical protein